jgi:hypothetical protein
MAYVHIRIEDDFYKAVQSVLESKLKTDISSFVRRVLQDALLIYGDDTNIKEALAGMGLKHEAQGTPSLILDMSKDWFLTHESDLSRFEGDLIEKLLKEIERRLQEEPGSWPSLSKLMRPHTEDFRAISAKHKKR